MWRGDGREINVRMSLSIVMAGRESNVRMSLSIVMAGRESNVRKSLSIVMETALSGEGTVGRATSECH